MSTVKQFNKLISNLSSIEEKTEKEIVIKLLDYFVVQTHLEEVDSVWTNEGYTYITSFNPSLKEDTLQILYNTYFKNEGYLDHREELKKYQRKCEREKFPKCIFIPTVNMTEIVKLKPNLIIYTMTKDIVKHKMMVLQQRYFNCNLITLYAPQDYSKYHCDTNSPIWLFSNDYLQQNKLTKFKKHNPSKDKRESKKIKKGLRSE